MHFREKVIWVTGASSGIGAELAVQLAKQGGYVILTGRNEQALKEVHQTCSKYNEFCKIVVADLSTEAGCLQACNQAMELFQHIDIVFLNAGVTQRSLAIDTDIAVYRSLMDINFYAPLIITKQLLPYFKQRNNGQIVAISSVAGLMGFPLRSGYAAAKHAMKGFFETLQTENNIEGLSITLVSPGRINTPISVNALTKDGTPHLKHDEGQLNGISVKVCATKILKAVAQKKQHIIIARGESLLLKIKWYLPSLYYKIAHNKGLKSL